MDLKNQILRSLSEKIGQEIIINKKYYFECDNYIFLSYNSRDFLENNNISKALLGNKPIVIDKKSMLAYKLLTNEGIDRQNLEIQDLIKQDQLVPFRI